jgi:hypothetical protein
MVMGLTGALLLGACTSDAASESTAILHRTYVEW